MPGTIVFKPLEANIVSKDKDILGKMDPYLSFHLGGLKRVKTEVAKSGGQHPIWNDAVTVEVTDQTSLTVDLKDKDMLIDDKIGSFEVDLREVQSQGRVRKWYPIFRKNEPAGELLMEATFSGGQYGASQGQYGTQGVYAGGLSQGQYGTTQGLSQGQYGTQGVYAGGLTQGQYGTSQGLSQGQYGTTQGLSQGQYGTSQGQYLSSGSTGSYGQGQSGHIITTPGTVIGHTSQSYPVQSTTQTSQYGGLKQGQYSSGQYSSIPQTTSLGGASTQYGGNQQLGGPHLGVTPLGGVSTQHGGSHLSGAPTQYGGSHLGGVPTQYGGSQLGGVPSQYGNIPQNQFSGVSGGFPQTQSYGAPSTEQFAKEAILRGSDPLNTQQNYYHNVGMGGYGGHPSGQNLTQTPSFSGTDPLLYEGDKNRFSNPPQQISYPGKNVETYGLKHGQHSGTGAGTGAGTGSGTGTNPQYY